MLHPYRPSQDRSGRAGGGVGVGIDPFAIRDNFTTILAGVRFVRRLIHAFDVSRRPLGDQQGSNRFGVGHRIHLALAQRQAQFSSRIYLPVNVFAGIDPVGSENPVGEDERRSAHPGNANPFPFQILDLMNRAVHAGLDSQTSRVHSSEKPHIQTLLDWFEEIHHQMVRDVVAAERKVIFVSGPTRISPAPARGLPP